MEAVSLRAADVILAIDGEPVRDLGSLSERVANLDSSTVFQIQVSRDRRKMIFEGRIGPNPTPSHRRAERI